MTKALFVQPRHPYAPAKGLGQVYMPTALLTAQARLLHAGAEVAFKDYNLESFSPRHLTDVDVVGTHTIGPSCLPSTLDLQERILAAAPQAQIVHGGQVISSLDRVPFGDAPRFRRLFGEDPMNGNNDFTLAALLSVDGLPPVRSTSLIPAYERLEESSLGLYLRNPFSLFVAQGCKQACDFCSAVRTHRDPLTRDVHRVTEMYRDIDVIHEDLSWLAQHAAERGIPHLTMYMSNLDLCQTPEKLAAFAEAVLDVTQRYAVSVKLTGLATLKEFKEMDQQHPTVLARMREAGLTNIGFGVEGASEKYWNPLKKGHNTLTDCYEVPLRALAYGFTPELLLTPGHEHETAQTLQDTVAYAEYMSKTHPVIIRPYAAKVWLTGNSGWHSGTYDTQINQVLENPWLFQNLDINAMQSRLIEENDARRAMINTAFVRLCELSKGAAPYLVPYELRWIVTNAQQ